MVLDVAPVCLDLPLSSLDVDSTDLIPPTMLIPDLTRVLESTSDAEEESNGYHQVDSGDFGSTVADAVPNAHSLPDRLTVDSN